MRADCVQAVEKAIGRSITAQEADGIEKRLVLARQQLARQDQNAFTKMGRDAQWQEAGRIAARELLQEAEKQTQRATLALLTHDKNVATLREARAKGRPMFKGLGDLLNQADIYSKGVAQQYMSSLYDAWKATSPRFFGLIEDAQGLRALLKEMFGEDSGSEVAKKGAQIWKTTTDAIRERANAAGFDIWRRKDWHLPQLHDAYRVRRAALEQWVSDVMPLVDRKQYVTTDGRRMTDEELSETLASMKRTIGTEGVADLESAQGQSMLARRHEESRELHFKDADSWLKYHIQYGKGTVYEAMQSHVAGLSRDIGLAETFGPNAEAAFKTLHDSARRDSANHGGIDAIGPFFVSTENIWKTLSGYTAQVYSGEQPGYRRFADMAQTVRNVEVWKLGSAFLSAVTDLPTYFITTNFNRLPMYKSFDNLVTSFGKDSKSFANRAGLMAESIVSDVNRFYDQNVGRGFSGRVANATMRVSLLNAWTDAIRRAFSITMMGAMGKLSRTEWGALDEFERSHYGSKGITETDWKVYQLAAPEMWKGEAMLTPEAIKAIPAERLARFGDPAKVRNAAITRLLGAILDESQYASVAPDLLTRASLQRGTQKGTLLGETARSIALFKSFPIAMVNRHLVRATQTERFGGLSGPASRVAYFAAMFSTLSIFGGLALQAKDLRDGKDPRDMTEGKFWLSAFLQGGGAGIFGDFIYTGLGGKNRYDHSLASTLAGPVWQSAEDLYDLTLGNAGEALQDKDTHAAAEALRFAKAHAPFANLWYLRTVIDHAGLQELQEYVSPGYLERIRSKVQSDTGQDFYWQPGSGLEGLRAPDFERAVGE